MKAKRLVFAKKCCWLTDLSKGGKVKCAVEDLKMPALKAMCTESGSTRHFDQSSLHRRKANRPLQNGLGVTDGPWEAALWMQVSGVKHFFFVPL